MANSNELEQLERIVLKLDDSIDKLTEVSANISKLLAVQEQRMNTIEKDTDRNQDDIRHLYGKLDSVTKTLSDKIDESMKNSSIGHEKIQKALDEKLENYDNRIKVLEMWRWLIIGGAFAAMWFVNKFLK
jgi:ABC-type transporter Mla subunit MlaD